MANGPVDEPGAATQAISRIGPKDDFQNAFLKYDTGMVFMLLY